GAARRRFGQDRGEIGCFLGQHKQFGMTVEQRYQQRSARFRLASNKTGALLEREVGSHEQEITTAKGERVIPSALKRIIRRRRRAEDCPPYPRNTPGEWGSPPAARLLFVHKQKSV